MVILSLYHISEHILLLIFVVVVVVVSFVFVCLLVLNLIKSPRKEKKKRNGERLKSNHTQYNRRTKAEGNNHYFCECVVEISVENQAKNAWIWLLCGCSGVRCGVRCEIHQAVKQYLQIIHIGLISIVWISELECECGVRKHTIVICNTQCHCRRRRRCRRRHCRRRCCCSKSIWYETHLNIVVTLWLFKQQQNDSTIWIETQNDTPNDAMRLARIQISNAMVESNLLRKSKWINNNSMNPKKFISLGSTRSSLNILPPLDLTKCNVCALRCARALLLWWA